ncbi:hypothetical protein GCM10027614_32310 [Micromonospora vulcania]
MLQGSGRHHPHRAGAGEAAARRCGEKVKAVASSVAAAPAAEQGSASSRRRARKGASAERTVVEVVETDTNTNADSNADADYQDTMGYDLSRYEADTAAAPAVSDAQQGESARLAAADDPDALADGDADEEGPEGGTGRRRSRRGGARRRTRP